MRIGFEVQDVQDLYLGTSEALTERPHCLLGMQGLVDSQQDFHGVSVLLAARLPGRKTVRGRLGRYPVG